MVSVAIKGVHLSNFTFSMGYTLGKGTVDAVNNFLVSDKNHEAMMKHGVRWSGKFVDLLIVDGGWAQQVNVRLREVVVHFVASVLIAAGTLAESNGRKQIKAGDIEFVLYASTLFL